MRRDMDETLQGWPYEPEPGEVIAREIRARDGRTVLQIRIELGLLQWRSRAGPTAIRPHGFATYLDYLRHRAAREAARRRAARRRPGRCRASTAPRPTASSSSTTTVGSPG